MAERKLDIFNLLSKLDTNKINWFSQQPQDVQGEFAAPVVQRWLSSTIGNPMLHAYYLQATNESCNVHMWTTAKHPELLYKLMASIGVGKTVKHQWIPNQKNKNTNNKARAFIASLYPMNNDEEIDIIFSSFTNESFLDFVEGAGLSQEEEKEILKAYGIKVTKRGKK